MLGTKSLYPSLHWKKRQQQQRHLEDRHDLQPSLAQGLGEVAGLSSALISKE